jgi:hypothetical protein
MLATWLFIEQIIQGDHKCEAEKCAEGALSTPVCSAAIGTSQLKVYFCLQSNDQTQRRDTGGDFGDGSELQERYGLLVCKPETWFGRGSVCMAK